MPRAIASSIHDVQFSVERGCSFMRFLSNRAISRKH
jgi:hypothetical protein